MGEGKEGTVRGSRRKEGGGEWEEEEKKGRGELGYLRALLLPRYSQESMKD